MGSWFRDSLKKLHHIYHDLIFYCVSVSGCNCLKLRHIYTIVVPTLKTMDSRGYIAMSWAGASGSNPMCQDIQLHNEEVIVLEI